jgi:hypothetical protein
MAMFLIASAVGVTALIQTDFVYNMDDTYVNDSAGDTNFDAQTLRVYNGAGDVFESWFRFNLSDPTGYYVVGAELYAYTYAVVSNKDYSMSQAASTDWTETNITWNNKPGYGAAVTQTTIGVTGWFSWDITGTYSSDFSSGTGLIAYALTSTSGSDLSMEDKENTQGTGNVPYMNLTMMIPEVYLLSPPDADSTYESTVTFQYNTTDAGNIINCSLVLDGVVNMTNTSVVENSTSTFMRSGIFPGDHTWTVKCFDSNRYVYEMTPAARDITILASVEWYNPSSLTPLDIGTSPINGADASGTRQIYSNNTNNNVQVSCASGDCGVVTTNWSTSSMSSGDALTAVFNCSTDTAGSFQADFEVSSDQDASVDTLTVNCTILAPDLRVNSTNITFTDDTPTENQEINITAGIYNDGDYDASSIVVRFYDGHYSTGSQIGGDQTIDLSAGASTTVTQNWTTTIGAHDIYVTVDPPVDTNGTINESDESNNYAYKTLDIPMWTYFVGNVTGTLALQTEDNSTVLKWNVADTTSSLVYVTDTDSNPEFSSLIALSRNTTGSYMSDDFTELDSELSTTTYPDSINLTYTSAGNPIETSTFTAFGNSISNVPITNSTNSSTFVTGILWDSDDDTNNNNQFDSTSDEDVVFVTRVNQSQVGMYGTYDYEIRVPARLKNFKGPDVQTVTFYTEIK